MPVIEELARIRGVYLIKILAYVIMPSHVHFVLHPENDCDMGRIIGALKARSTGKILDLLRLEDSPLLPGLKTIKDGKSRHSFWQPRCYDHNCRSLDAVREKINYCHMNPVRAGLVADPSDWLWSSYRWYCGMDVIVLAIDGVEL